VSPDVQLNVRHNGGTAVDSNCHSRLSSTSGVLGFDFAKTTEAELNIMTSNWTVCRNKSWYKILLLNVKHLESW